MWLHAKVPFWKMVCDATDGTGFRAVWNGYTFNIQFNMTEIPQEGMVTSCQGMKLYIIC